MLLGNLIEDLKSLKDSLGLPGTTPVVVEVATSPELLLAEDKAASIRAVEIAEDGHKRRYVSIVISNPVSG